MAASATVGILRVLLEADSSTFQAGVAKAASASQSFTKDLNAAGAKAEAVGAAMDKAFSKAEEGTRGLSRAVGSLIGFDVIEKANTYAKAVEAIGGATKLTANEQSKINAIVTEATAKYAALGREAPAALTSLAKATEGAGQSSSKFMGDLTSQIQASALGFLSAQAVIGAVQSGAHAIVGFVADSINAYAQQETAIKKVTVALQAQGNATPEVVAGYQDMAAEFQRTTAFGDDAINEMQALLVEVGNVGPDQMHKALEAATDLSVGLGIDLRQATMLVGKAFEGNSGSLKKFGIDIDETKFKTEGATVALDAIQRKFGGQAAAEAETYAGKIKQMANAWGEVQEAVGKSIVTDPIILAFMQQLTAEITHTSDAASEGAGSFTEWWAQVIGGDSMRLVVESFSTIEGLFQQTAASVRAAAKAAQGNAPDLFKGGFGALRPDQQKFLDDYAANMERNAAADKKAADAAAAHAKAIRTLVDQYAGTTAIKAALDVTEALTVAHREGITVAKMGTAAQDEAHATLQKGIDAYKRLGIEAPAGLRAAYTETFRLDALLDEFEPKLSALPSGLAGIGEAITNSVVPPLNTLSTVVQTKLDDQFRAFFAKRYAEEFKRLSGQMIADAREAEEAERKRVQQVERAWAGLAGGLSTVGSQLEQFGGKYIAVAADVAQGTGTMIGAVRNLQKAWAESNQGALAMAATTVQSVTLVLSYYQTAVNIVEKLIDQLSFAESRAAIAQRGGAAMITQAAATAGKPSLADSIFNARNATAFRTALQVYDQAIADSTARLQRYGLTWKDLGENVRRANIEGMTRQLVLDAQAFYRMGLQGTQQTSAMSQGLNQLIIDAVETGQKIPAALAPMLKTLIESGQLSDEAARSLLGMSGKAVVAFKDVEAAAGRYGIKVEQLGKAVNQLRINEVAQQIIADWELLQTAGADTNTVLVGMQDEVQNLVTEALTAGYKIPEGMRPIIQAMMDAGLLIDANGDKLTDLGKLEFEKPLTEAIGDLVAALKDLIDWFSKVGTSAEEGFGRARGAAESVGQAVPRGTAGTGTPPPASGDTSSSSTPPPAAPPPVDTPSPAAYRRGPTTPGRRYASGGLVGGITGRLLSFPSPLGGDRVPILAQEGEAILNVPAVRAIGREGINRLNTEWLSGMPSPGRGRADAGAVTVSVSVAINNPVVQDEAQLVALKRVMEDAVVDVLNRENATNARGVKTLVRRMAS